MKILLWILAALVALVALVFGLQLLASERVEVIELHATNQQGQTEVTRLWIVDDDGYQYLRGDEGSRWYQRIKKGEPFKVTRNGTTAAYTFKLRQDKVDTINDLFHEKYTWGDEFIELLIGGREGALAIELLPAPTDDSR